MIPVILSGGSGTRLWPVSRNAYPKQFCDFLDESLFNKALKRVLPLGSPWVVTVKDLQVLTERALREFQIPTTQVLYEPLARNTAPAVALLCKVLELRGLSNEIVGVFPADQLIADDGAFHAAVREAEKFAREGHVVTLGVKPSYPATGYGYIETSGRASSEGVALKAAGFREKPDAVTAQRFLDEGGYFWNAGMFIFKVSRMVEHFSSLAPQVWEAFSGLKADLNNLTSVYQEAPSISIDYAVMEKLSEHVCVPCGFDWSDLGSWDAISSLSASSGARDRLTEVAGAKRNFIYPQANKEYAFVGVEELIVVDTADALLVAKKGTAEKVKEAVDALKARVSSVALQHSFEVRPWGRFDVLFDDSDFKSKVITVDPGAQLSYQSHEKRAEHWIVVRGHGEVVLDDKVVPVSSGDHIHIPIGAKHRMRNTGEIPLKFVEVQLGSYFGENDIIRYEDDYKRV